MLHYLFVSSRPSLAMTFWVFPFVYFGLVLLFALPIEKYVHHTLAFELIFYIYLITVFVWIFRVWSQTENCSSFFPRFLAKAFTFCILAAHIHILNTMLILINNGTISLGNFESFEAEYIKLVLEDGQKKSSHQKPVTRNPMKTAKIDKYFQGINP